MTFSFDADLLAPLYDSDLAIQATLIVHDSAGGSYPVTIIDHTAGLAVTEPARPGRITVETIRPVAYLRHSALLALGLALGDLEGAELTINYADLPPVTWSIKSYQVEPTPTGAGQIQLILIAED